MSGLNKYVKQEMKIFNFLQILVYSMCTFKVSLLLNYILIVRITLRYT